MSYPLPQPTPLSQPYWDALKQGRLTFQRCQRCGHAWLPPRAECPECLAADWAWTEACGRGRIVSWVVYHHAYHDAFKDRLPYNVALVELEEGPRLITNIVNPGHGGGIAIERPVALRIETEQDFALARFALT
ncbi:MAG TPA: OB-fold domain-containing protein [Pseudorhodoplanes sp.]|jgi:uncharacterized OB-fold protein|nr:OB-fold domain-containing protein [Pseudorhodoplanes sp.]